MQLRRLATIPVALALAACSGGLESNGATSATPANVLGDGKRISDLLGPGLAAPPAAGVNVYVTGVALTVVDTYDETADGKSAQNIYVQDASFDRAAQPAWHGVTVYKPSFSPPALKVTPGDVLDFRAALQGFPGPPTFTFPNNEYLPELSQSVASFRFEDAIPDPVDVAASDLATYSTAHPYFGMLVRIKDVTTGAPGSPPHFQLPTTSTNGAASPALTNELFALDKLGVAQGTHYASVVGIVTYFGTPTLAPRSASDLTP